jgi:hypothetical protein
MAVRVVNLIEFLILINFFFICICFLDSEDTDPENPSDETEESEIESDQDEFIGTSLDRPDLLRFDDLLRSFSKVHPNRASYLCEKLG